MRSRRVRRRATALTVTHLEDRTVPAGGLSRPVVPNEWLVSARGFSGTPAEQVGAINALFEPTGYGVRAVQHLGMDGTFLLRGPDDQAEVESALAGVGVVGVAEPNYADLRVARVPNDKSFGELYGLNNTGQTIQGARGTADKDIDAVEAWDRGTGTTKILMASIDTGVDYRHPDLYLNIAINNKEIPAAVASKLVDVDADGVITFWDLNDPQNIGSGKITDLNNNKYIDAGDLLKRAADGGWADATDTDGNGFTDDLVGWDFINDDNDPIDDEGHGTHTAGTMAAIGDNKIGVAGVMWKARVVPIKILGANGSGSLAAGTAGVNYANKLGVRVSNNSWGYQGGPDTALQAAVEDAGKKGYLFVAAAGNATNDNDANPFYPASYTGDNVITVAASDNRDKKAGFSNWGLTSVDVAAPGVNIYSTVPGGGYEYNSGTSMAAPQVAGVAALAWSISPAVTYTKVRDAVLGGVEAAGDFRKNGTTPVATGGRVNLDFTLNVLGLTVRSTVPPVGSTVTSPLTDFAVIFNQAVVPGTVDPADFTVNGVPASRVVVSEGNTRATFSFDASPLSAAGPQVMAVASGKIESAFQAGQTNLPFSGNITVTSPDFDAVALPAAAPQGALGWAAYQDGMSTWINLPGDADTFTLNLDAGTKVQAVVDQVLGLRPKVTLVGPLGAELASASSPAPGRGAATGAVDARIDGAYKLVVEGLDGTSGAYRVRLLVGATAEAEAVGGAANNTPAAAQVLADEFVPYGAGAAAATVAGDLKKTDTADFYAVPMTAGDRLTIGLARSLGGAATLELTDPSGAPAGTFITPANFDQAVVVPSAAFTGDYLLKVVGTGAAAGETYSLSVVRGGAAVDAEPNATRPTAQPVPLPGVARGGIAEVTDVDFYSVDVPAGATLTVWTETPGSAPGEFANALNPIVEVFRGVSSVARDDNAAGDGRNALVRVANTGAATATYAIQVSGRLGSVGEYRLFATTDPLPGPVGVRSYGLDGTGQDLANSYKMAEGGDLTLTATGVSPTGRPLTYAWDLNGDGDYSDATGTSPTVVVPWAAVQNLGVRNGPGVSPVFVRVSDGITAVDSTGVVLSVSNTAPSGTTTLGGTVGESDTVTVGFLGASDPSQADEEAGLRFAFDFDNDGKWDLGDGTYAGSKSDLVADIPTKYIPDGAGAGTAYQVKVRVVDQDGGATDRLVDFRVVNTPPLAEFAEPAVPFRENQDGRTLTVAGIRDSLPDTAAGFTYSFDFDGDGTWDFGKGTKDGSLAITNGTVAVPRRYFPEGPVAAPLTVRARIFDKDGTDLAGGYTDFAIDLPILNAPPTATGFTSDRPGGVDEGGKAAVTVAGATDPSAADEAEGLRYSFGVRRADGTVAWFAGNGAGYAGSVGEASAAVPAVWLSDGSAAGVTVVARVVDRDNGFTDYATTIPVRNVAPTASAAVAAVGGGPLTVAAKMAVTFSNVADPSGADIGAGFRYSVDLNNDGDYEDADIGEVSGSADPVVTVPGFEVPGRVTIRARVEDKDGGFSEYPLDLTVDNVAPTVTPGAAAAVREGDPTATVRVTATHPSSITSSAGFRYAYDFDGDGNYEVGVGTANGADGYAKGSKKSSAAVPATFLTDGGKTLNVKVRVYEINGLFSDATVPVEVGNVAPTARLQGPTDRVEVRTPTRFAFVAPADPSPQDTAAGFRYSFDFNNDGDFADAGDVADSATPTATAQFTLTGPYTVRARVTDKDGGFTDYTAAVTVGTLTKTFYAAGVGAGNAPVARLYDGAGNVVYAGQVFGAEAAGGVRVSTADVTGDGTPDLVAATGPGSPAEVAVVDGKTQAVVFRVRPFGAFTGGAYVATGDTDGDGKAEVVVTPDEGGGPRVVMYSGAGFRQTASFFGIADPNFRGGARAAMADINGDGLSDLLVSAGFGGGPRVSGYDGRFLTTTRAKLFNDFFAFDPSLRNGVFLSGGDINGDGRAEVVLGAGPGGGPQVRALDGAALMQGVFVERANFFAQDIANRSGVRVTVADVDNDGRADIVTGDASGPGLNVFRGRSIQASGRPTDEFELFPFSALMNGVYVG